MGGLLVPFGAIRCSHSSDFEYCATAVLWCCDTWNTVVTATNAMTSTVICLTIFGVIGREETNDRQDTALLLFTIH